MPRPVKLLIAFQKQRNHILMPYIKQRRRAELNKGASPNTAGELNYSLARVIDGWLNLQGIKYDTLNTVAGVLACLSMEVYRRITSPYEDNKLHENGEVFSGL